VEAADKIDIRKDAKLVGDIKTSRIVIEDGAYFKGSIEIDKTGDASSSDSDLEKPAYTRSMRTASSSASSD
jgi:cytoskeletal protein CcmA (bactofilin family)